MSFTLLMKWLLKAKHWQIFYLTFGVPVLYQLIFFAVASLASIFEYKALSLIFLIMLRGFGITMMFFLFMIFAWYWTVAQKLDGLIPIRLKLNLKAFKIACAIPLVYLICISLYVSWNIYSLKFATENTHLVEIIAPLHFISFACILYCGYFIARSLKTAELQQKVKYADYGNYIFMLLAFPIGVWFIQPKINALLGSEKMNFHTKA